jgi:hypothetical protein
VSISDLDVVRTANLAIGQHGDSAIEKAREHVADLQAKGDLESADVWLRVIVAIETLQRPRPTHSS